MNAIISIDKLLEMSLNIPDYQRPYRQIFVIRGKAKIAKIG